MTFETVFTNGSETSGSHGTQDVTSDGNSTTEVDHQLTDRKFVLRVENLTLGTLVLSLVWCPVDDSNLSVLYRLFQIRPQGRDTGILNKKEI